MQLIKTFDAKLFKINRQCQSDQETGEVEEQNVYGKIDLQNYSKFRYMPRVRSPEVANFDIELSS